MKIGKQNKMKYKWNVSIFVVSILMVSMMLCLVSCATADSDTPESSREATQDITSETTDVARDESQQPYVLEFSAVTSEGEEFTSERLADSKLTMINVWGTFCGPCLNEMPDLGEIAAQYNASEFQLIGIVSDVMEGATEKELESLRELINETGANYPHLLLNEELYVNLVGASEYVPTTYFFNQDAELLTYVVGAKSKEDWLRMIEELRGML